MKLELPSIESNVLDNLTTAVVVFDEDLRVRYLNQMAEMLLAVSARHVLGHLPDEWLTCEGESLTTVVQATARGTPITRRGITLSVGGKAEITVDCTVSPVQIPGDESLVIVELQHLDRHLRISREEVLITQQAATRDVVRGLAHEIKNPLGGLRGAAQLLEAELFDEELKEYTQVIIEEADRLQNLVNSMLGPNRRPNLRTVNIHQVLERVRTLATAESGERIAIDRDYDPSIPEITADQDQLIQALLNIVGNAVRVLTVEEGGRIVLRTRIQRNFTIGNQRHKLAVQIDVTDNGPGIPPEIADTLFFPMVTAQSGGMGLGLSITQALITQHGGIVECKSKPGDTVFTLYLPVDGQVPQ